QALDDAVLPRRGAAREGPARAGACRATVPEPRAGGRILPVAVAAGPADPERRAVSAAESRRRARALRALLLSRAGRAVGAQGRMRANLLCSGRRDRRARSAGARTRGAGGFRRGPRGAGGAHRAFRGARAALTTSERDGVASSAGGKAMSGASADAIPASASSEPQAARAVLMIRPQHFGVNVETAGSNRFQPASPDEKPLPGADVAAAALAE